MPRTRPRAIEKIYAFVAIHADGDETLMFAKRKTDGARLPLICSSLERVEQLVPLAERIAAANGCDVDVVELSGRVSVLKAAGF